MVLSKLTLRLVRWLIVTAVVAVVMLAVAGRADLVMLNAYLAMCAVIALAMTLVVDPDLVRERLRPQKGEDEARLLAIRLLFAALFTIALLDIGHLHASDSVPRPLQILALVVAFVGFLFVVWAMAANRFFVPVIRIQSERGHQVVDRGPYEWVRHPGYAGLVLLGPASALALGSWWALVPALVVAALFVRRAAHEDHFLRQHLDGYAKYAARVRFRLIPGIW